MRRQERDKKTGAIKKLTFRYVKSEFKRHDCVLLSKEYKNARTHLDYRCSCGNTAKIIFDSFRRGHRCKLCGSKKNAQSQALKFEDVKKYIEDHECKLFEDKYISARTKMKMQCRCGNFFYRNFNGFKDRKMYTCFACSVKKRSGKNHYEWKEDREQLAKERKFRDRIHGMLNFLFKRLNLNKTKSNYDIFGYSSSDLRKYIKSHNNWEKLSKDENWEIDHIFPIKAFIDFGILEPHIINSLDNLQPMKVFDNRSKGDSYDKYEFQSWLRGKGVSIDI